MNISSVMSPNPLTISASTQVADAKKEMTERGIRHLLVTEEGAVLGVLTADAVKSASVAGAKSAVKDICSPNFLVVDRESDLSEVAREMAAQKLSCVVIADDSDRPIGIFTTTDACAVLARLLEKVEGSS